MPSLPKILQKINSYLPLAGGTLNGGVLTTPVPLVDGVIDISLGNVFTKTITENTSFSIRNALDNKSTEFLLVLKNGGNFVINYPDHTYWENDEPPALKTNGTDILKFITFNGVIWYVINLMPFVAGSVGMPTTTEGGRVLYRHGSGMGTVMEFNDGQDRRVLVLDAAYRSIQQMATKIYDFGLTKYSFTNINGTGRLYGTNAVLQTPQQHHDQCALLTDEQINTIWVNSIDTNTGKQNTDIILASGISPAAEAARNITVPGLGPCDIPNIQTLMRIFCEADNLDAMDPTIEEYGYYALGQVNINHSDSTSFYFDFHNAAGTSGNGMVNSSTENSNNYMLIINAHALIGLDYFSYKKNYVHGLVPVIELN